MTYTFSILVKRNNLHYSSEEKDLITKKQRRYLFNEPMGTTKMMLTDDKGKQHVYAFGYDSVLLTLFTAMAGAHFLTLLSPFAALLMPPILGRVMDFGAKSQLHHHDRIDFTISKEKHDKMFNELSQEKYGIYHIFFRSCTGFALDFASKHGLNTPQYFRIPDALSWKIKRMEERQTTIMKTFKNADNEIASLFSDQPPTTELSKPKARSLKTRLKNEGLGF